MDIPRNPKGSQEAYFSLFLVIWLVLALFVPGPGRYRIRNGRLFLVGFLMKKQMRKCHRSAQEKTDPGEERP